MIPQPDKLATLPLGGSRAMVGSPIYMWVILLVVIGAAIAVDLSVFHRKGQPIKFQKALVESTAWIGLALLFDLWVYVALGHQAGLEFLTSYVVEKSLSVDNIFLFVLIFQALSVPPESQHRVLYSGVVGALGMRAAFIFAGIALLRHFHPALFVFGAILLVTGVRMLLPGARTVSPERNWLVRLTRRVLPVTDGYRGDSFWVREGGKWNATPLFVALIAVETMDILFAVDSVPAVLAITRSSFIAYSSNVFAILGLRAMYFGLAGVLPRFRFLHPGLAAILIFVGTKMVIADRIPIPTGVSLGVLAGILSTTVCASMLWPRARKQ